MTGIDPRLVHRAEQALLGALITSPGQVGPAGVTAADFADPRHQAIFAALAATGSPGWPGRIREWLARLISKRARDTAVYMRELPAWCPEPAHQGAYAAMVSHASDQRRDAARTQEAGQQAGLLASADAHLAGLAQSGSRGGRPDGAGLPGDVARLARTLQPTAARMTRQQQDTVARSAPTAQPGGGAAEVPAKATPAVAVPVQPSVGPEGLAAGQPTGRTRMSVEDFQDYVLADLIRRPADARNVVTWLPAGVFSEGPRRDLYELVRETVMAGGPVDPLIMAWHAARLPAAAPSPEFVLRTEELGATPGTAEVIGRVLLADHVCTVRFGVGWAQSTQLTQPTARPTPASAVPEPPEPGSAPGLATRKAAAAMPRAAAAPTPRPTKADQAPQSRRPPAPARQEGGPVPRM